MIEKFNLYDVYGYFLPGLALIAVLWFPFGVVTHSWPRGDWASAITAVALSYFVGHLMLYVSTKVLPSDDVTKSGDHLRRKYSATVLDGDSDLPTSLREKIASAVTREFDMHMHPEDSTGQYDNDRNAAFELARQRLILDDAKGYAEQFQGMYSLTRGLVSVFAVSTAYYSGWVLSLLPWRFLFQIAVILLFVSVLCLINTGVLLWWDWRHKRERREGLGESDLKRLKGEDRERENKRQLRFAYLLLVAFGIFGLIVGAVYNLDAKMALWLALAAAISPALWLRCYTQYHSFAAHFASTVWRDFTAYTQKNTNAESQI